MEAAAMDGWHPVEDLVRWGFAKVHKHLLRDRGAGPGVWDREAAGIVLRRGSR